MVEEQSIKNQIAAMEGWAIKAKQSADAGKYEEANELLRTINTQGRRLEWRGGRLGIKHLPEMEEVKTLKKKITEARAAAQTAQSSIQHMEKVIGKEKKGASKEEHFALERKKAQYQKEITKSLAILIEMAKQANAIAKDEPWINPTYLIKKENYNFLLEFFRKERYYGHLDVEERKDTIKKFSLWFKNGFFKGSDLSRAKLQRADLRIANLRGANLQGADFWIANLGGADLRVANLQGADLRIANLQGADFWGANLEGANLNGANLEGANLRGANLEGANLERANLQRTDFGGANLGGANLLRANFGGANLGEANLRGADFLGANLEGANLQRANLQRANLWGANLQRANLLGANLGEANLEGANLWRANLESVKNLTKAQLHAALNWDRAKNAPTDLG